MKRDLRYEEHYAYELPYMGVLYKEMHHEEVGRGANTENKRLNDMWIEIYNNPQSPVQRKTKIDKWYHGKTLEEIQSWQNYGE